MQVLYRATLSLQERLNLHNVLLHRSDRRRDIERQIDHDRLAVMHYSPMDVLSHDEPKDRPFAGSSHNCSQFINHSRISGPGERLDGLLQTSKRVH